MPAPPLVSCCRHWRPAPTRRATGTGQVCAFSDIFLGDVASNALTGSLTVAAVPEPSTYALLIAGLTAVGWRRRRGASAVAQVERTPELPRIVPQQAEG